MYYIFVFLGEFGYEIFNWQGCVRKFYSTIDKKKDKIIIGGRKGLELFYEFADLYIDISHLKKFKNSVASMYRAHNPDLNDFKFYKEVQNGLLKSKLNSKQDYKYTKALKRQIKIYIKYCLIKKNIINIFDLFTKKVKFIFSSDYKIINGIEFGTYGPYFIYKDLKLYNNVFKRIEPFEEDYDIVQQKLPFNLKDGNFILCQSGSRDIVTRDNTKINYYDIISELGKYIKIVLLNFDTNRKFDSKYFFTNINDCIIYTTNSFREQAMLIKYCKHCLFFTEGDFRSYNYIPPFLGKNIYSIIPKGLLNTRTTPIDFWNDNIYKCIGEGKIIPIIYEKLSDKLYRDDFFKKLLK